MKKLTIADLSSAKRDLLNAVSTDAERKRLATKWLRELAAGKERSSKGFAKRLQRRAEQKLKPLSIEQKTAKSGFPYVEIDGNMFFGPIRLTQDGCRILYENIATVAALGAKLPVFKGKGKPMGQPADAHPNTADVEIEIDVDDETEEVG